MARIVGSRSVETLRGLELDEYGNTLSFRKQTNGSAAVEIVVPDPAREERRLLREGIVDGEDFTVSDVLAWLEARDMDGQNTYTSEPIRYSVSFWMDRDTADAVANLLSDEDLSYSTRKTIEAQSVKEQS